jgi:hypothetical protein
MFYDLFVYLSGLGRVQGTKDTQDDIQYVCVDKGPTRVVKTRPRPVFMFLYLSGLGRVQGTKDTLDDMFVWTKVPHG